LAPVLNCLGCVAPWESWAVGWKVLVEVAVRLPRQPWPLDGNRQEQRLAAWILSPAGLI
jgi:hypothetical protein